MDTQLKFICIKFKVTDLYDLHSLYHQLDQEAITNGTFDYTDSSLRLNKIKNALLEIDCQNLKATEGKIIKSILWLWYHHATTVAIWQRKDIKQARIFCKHACEYLYSDHPNTITPMISMLLEHNIQSAKEWYETKVAEVEKPYARHLLDEYAKGVFNI